MSLLITRWLVTVDLCTIYIMKAYKTTFSKGVWPWKRLKKIIMSTNLLNYRYLVYTIVISPSIFFLRVSTVVHDEHLYGNPYDK